MKKLNLLILSIVMCLLTACHGNLWDAIEDLNSRVARLEELCKEMNTNISALQTIVSVLQENDYISGIMPIEKGGEVIGYVIMFGKHDPITIYNGDDGKDSANGSSSTPIIGVAKDTDGVYYWTLNGEWLLDENGNKIRVTGEDGKGGADGKDGQDGVDGKDGQDGQTGTNGTNGKDGITPQLKIENGYWYVSYDNGATCTELGKAVGENGEKGDKGDKGDSMFTSVIYDDNYVYFTLTDGTILVVPKNNGINDFDQTVIDNLVNSLTLDKVELIFSYNEIGTTKTIIATTLPFAESKVTWVSSDSAIAIVANGIVLAMGSGECVITAFAGDKEAECLVVVESKEYEYVDLGLSVKWATCNIGATIPEEYGDYFAWGEVESKTTYDWNTYKYGSSSALNKYCTSSSLGSVDNKTILDPEDDAATVNWGGKWRIPTAVEVSELLGQCTWTWTTQYGVKGYKVVGKNGNSIFLPAAGYMNGTSLYGAWSRGYYRSSWLLTDYSCDAVYLDFTSAQVEHYGMDRCYGLPIRPVCP